eukprot:scaffold661_cov106-Cylindrotheca_fusiformis.AAC.2
MVHGETLPDICHHSFEGHPLQHELEDQYMQVYEYYGGNKLLREVGSNYRLSEDDGPFFLQQPPIDLGRGCLLDFSLSSNGRYCFYLIDQDKILAECSAKNMVLIGRRATVGQALLDAGIWTEETVWNPVTLPRYPEERLIYNGLITGDDRDFHLQVDYELPLPRNYDEEEEEELGDDAEQFEHEEHE